INGLSRKGLVEMDTSGVITNKSFNLSNSKCTEWLFEGNNIWIGSNSFVIGGMNRPRLAQVDLTTGFATCWDPLNTGLSSIVWPTALDVYQDTVYIGCSLTASSFNYFETLVGNPSYVNAGPDLSICPPAPFTLNAQNAGFQSYLWSNGGTTASITSAVPGLYWVTASNTSLGCSATDSVYVDFCTSLEDPDEKDLLKVVQPVGDYLQFKIDSRIGDGEFKIEVMDLAGKTVLSSFGASGENSISVSGLKPSIYLLRIRTVANKQLFAKFLKE
ncbi:MAG: T9SS type A sorting domain-containing protein, partial [Bacteroidia bacterium]